MPKNVYRNSKGEVLPGTSTIASLLGKGEGIPSWSHRIAHDSTVALIEKAYKEQGVVIIPKYEEIQRWQDVRDSAGDVGTKVHEAILQFWQGYVLPTDDSIVRKCIDSFHSWVREQRESPMAVVVEIPLVSEKLKFGGQPDALLKVKGKYRLQDIKTSNAIYDNYWYQLAGYDILLRENGYKVDEYQILRIGKDGSIEAPIRTELKREKRIFKNLLKIWYDRRQE